MGEAEAAGDGCGSGSELEPATPLAGYFRPSFRRSRLVALCRPFRFPQERITGPTGVLGLRVTERYWANSCRQCSITRRTLATSRIDAAHPSGCRKCLSL